MAEKKEKKEDQKVNIDVPDIEYKHRDHILQGIHGQKDQFKKKFGDKWRDVANGIVHVHTTHRKDYNLSK